MSLLHLIRFSLMLLLFVATLFFNQLPDASADFLIVDDFDDGNISDGDPFSWVERRPAGTDNVIEARDGGLFIQLASEVPIGYRVETESRPWVDGDIISIRARVRLLSPGFIGLNPSYAGVIGINDFGGLAVSGGNPVGETSLRPLTEDLLMQVDVLESTSEFRIWRPGEEKPEEAIYEWSITRPRREPDIPNFAVLVGARAGLTSSGIFRWVAVANYVIPANFAVPEPSTTMLLAASVACLSGFRQRR